MFELSACIPVFFFFPLFIFSISQFDSCTLHPKHTSMESSTVTLYSSTFSLSTTPPLHHTHTTHTHTSPTEATHCLMEVFRNLVRPFAGGLVASAPPARPGFPRGKVMFRAQLFWQRVRDNHIVPGGLEFNLDINAGVNYARLKSETEVPSDGDYAAASVKTVADKDGQGDEECLSMMLRESAAAGDIPALKEAFQSCYVTRAASEPAVCEAAKLNQAETLSLLLEAGCPANAAISNKRALFFATENGSEDTAKLLLDRLRTFEIYKKNKQMQCNAFEAAERQDLTQVAKRLREYAVSIGKEEEVHEEEEKEDPATETTPAQK